MSKTNKVILWVVIVLAVILVALILWQALFASSSYYAVLLRTGDIYFGNLTKFPSFGLENVYTLQVTQDPENPLSVQKFSNLFWGPEDYLRINRDEVVWYTELSDASQLTQLFTTNPNLVPQQVQQPVPAGQ